MCVCVTEAHIQADSPPSDRCLNRQLSKSQNINTEQTSLWSHWVTILKHFPFPLVYKDGSLLINQVACVIKIKNIMILLKEDPLSLKAFCLADGIQVHLTPSPGNPRALLK